MFTIVLYCFGRVKTKRILVVCSGNTCRSPMAAGLLRRLLGGTADVQSAGIETHKGVPATKYAVAVMQELGIDIRDHQSCDISSLNLADFDVIVAMTPAIAERLQASSVKRTGIMQLNVRDPYGKNMDVYRKTAIEIEVQLRSLVEMLNEGRS